MTKTKTSLTPEALDAMSILINARIEALNVAERTSNGHDAGAIAKNAKMYSEFLIHGTIEPADKTRVIQLKKKGK